MAMNPEYRREEIKVLKRQENFAGAIGMAGTVEAIGSFLLIASNTGDERAMALAGVVAIIPATGGTWQSLRYSLKKQGLLYERKLYPDF